MLRSGLVSYKPKQASSSALSWTYCIGRELRVAFGRHLSQLLLPSELFITEGFVLSMAASCLQGLSSLVWSFLLESRAVTSLLGVPGYRQAGRSCSSNSLCTCAVFFCQISTHLPIANINPRLLAWAPFLNMFHDQFLWHLVCHNDM